MASSSFARRSTFLRTIWKTTTSSSSSSRLSPSSINSKFVFPHIHNSPSPSPSRLLRRELISLLPVHTAIASASLVSKISSDASISTEVEGILMRDVIDKVSYSLSLSFAAFSLLQLNAKGKEKFGLPKMDEMPLILLHIIDYLDSLDDEYC